MKYTLERGKRYGAMIQLEGIETWASDDMIASKFEEFGFKDVQVSEAQDDRRIVWGTWGKANMVGDMPPQVVYVEEAPE